MDFVYLFYAWTYYSMVYIFLSIVSTVLINHMLKKLYYAPLIINFITGSLLYGMAMLKVIPPDQATFSMYIHYVPVVLASIVFNTILFIVRKVKQIDKAADQ